jgi:cellulose biosynthesis protein BcsQ
MATAIKQSLGADALEKGVILRDASGRLTFVASSDPATADDRKRTEDVLRAALGPYVRDGRAIVFAGDPGASTILTDPLRVPIQIEEVFCQLLDRRIIGASWLDVPNSALTSPPRFVFASFKGGVGRSTALAIAAADLARRGNNVLVLDLDLEAPGLADLLLDEDRKPPFGTVDYLVEASIGSVLDNELDKFVGTSALTSNEGGRVDVVPAFGGESDDHPENVISKLSRALIEGISAEGEAISVTSRLTSMLDRLVSRAEYDVVLIDSRAGLGELSPPALLGLGAVVLLFGTAQKQTLEGYRALFAALKLLAQRDRALGQPGDWRLLLKAVYAKASLNEEVAAKYRDSLYEVFADYLYDAEEDGISEEESINFDIDDQGAPHWPIVIPFSQPFVDFDPVATPSQLSGPFYEQTFRPFLNDLDELIAACLEAVGPGGESQ